MNVMNKNSNKGKLEIKSQVKDTAEILMYGDVSKWDINARDLQSVLNDLDSKVTKIDLRLFSGGGDVFEGIAIYNILKRSDREVTVYIDGLAASIASVIMLAGDKIVMGEGSQVMIHLPWTFAMGSSRDLADTIDRLDRVENEMVKIYQKATGLSETEITSMMVAETWFNDDEALEFGFIDEKIEANIHTNIAASIKTCEWIKKKELAKANTEFKNKIQDTVNSLNDFITRK